MSSQLQDSGTEFCVAGRLVDGDDTKMKLENLAVSGRRRDQSRLSIISLTQVLGYW